MFSEETIQSCLWGLVGLRQNSNPDYPTFGDSIVQSGSRRLIHHPLINSETIDQLSHNFDHYSFPDWDIAATYNTGSPFGDRVRFVNEKVYESTADANTGNSPEVSPNQWVEVPLMTLYLEDLLKNSISKVVNDMFIAKKVRHQTKDILENIRLYEGAGRLTNKAIKEGRLVGFEMRLKRTQNLEMIIKKIGLQFDTAQPGNFLLRLYHSSQLNPIATITTTPTQAVSFQWHIVPGIPPINSASVDFGGSFYLMYDENDLVGQAIQKDNYDFSKRPCAGCSGYNLKAWNKWNKFVDILPISVSSNKRKTGEALDPLGVDLWDISQHSYNYTTNWGMNLELTMKCNVSDFICDQSEVFAEVIRKQATVDILQELSLSYRDNAIKDAVSQKARFSLQDRITGGEGLAKELEMAKKSIDFDMSDLSSSCLPCINKGNGLKARAIGVV